MELNNTIAEVYHYCNLNRFLSIVKHKQLWLVDLCKSNDRLERELIFDLFKFYLKLLRNNSENNSDNDVLKIAEQAEKYIPLFKQNDFSCGICFSSKNDLLSQWRGYADDGKGVSIGFNTAIFDDTLCGDPKTEYKCKCKFSKIEYDKVRELDRIKKITSKYSYDLDEPLQKINSLLLIADLWQEAMFFKHDSFAEESEYRFVVNDSKLNREEALKTIYLDNCVIYPREWFARDNDIISYRKLDFSSCDNPITSVTIGPKANVDTEDVKILLSDVGLDTDNIIIKSSVSSYR